MSGRGRDILVSLTRIAVAIASVAVALACHHQVSQDPNFWGCKKFPRFGPKSHLDVSLADAPDSNLQARDSGRLIVIVSWSSDSLARHSYPGNAQVEVSSTNKVYLVADSVGRAGPLELPVPPGAYRFVVRLIGAQTLDTSVTVRQGYADTARAYLQTGGMTLCA